MEKINQTIIIFLLIFLLSVNILVCGCIETLKVGQTAHLSNAGDHLDITLTDARFEDYSNYRYGFTNEGKNLIFMVNYKNTGNTKLKLVETMTLDTIDAGEEIGYYLHREDYNILDEYPSLRPGEEVTYQYKRTMPKGSNFKDYILQALKNEAKITIEWKQETGYLKSREDEIEKSTASWDVTHLFKQLENY